jgi:hypothetical protein
VRRVVSLIAPGDRGKNEFMATVDLSSNDVVPKTKASRPRS